MNKHTPGPWLCDSRVPTRVTGPKDRGICSTGGYQNNTQDAEQLNAEHEANARLIAAAPELLEALQTWQQFWDTMPKGQMGKLAFNVGLFNDGFIQMRRAIAKATGEQT